MTSAPAPQPGQPRRWLTLLAMTGSLSMIFVDTTVVGVALQEIRHGLQLGETGLQWVVNAYILSIASLVALGGRASDLLGRVPAFVAGVLIFTVASVLCGAARTGGELVAARVIQGLGAALMQPASGALVISAFAPGERGKAMAVYVGIPMLFMVIGPVLGGAITQWASWRWCFWVNVPVAALALLLTARARPADARAADRRLDIVGAVLILLGLPALVLGLQQGNEWGWRSPAVLACLAAGALLLPAFVAWELSRPAPLLQLRLFRDRGLLANGLLLLLMQFAMTGLVIYGSVYAQAVLGFAPMRAGASILPMLLPVLVVVHVAGRLYDRHGVRLPAITGTVLCTAGLAIQSLGAAWMNYPVMAAGMLLLGTGIGFVMSPTNTDSLSRVPGHQRGQTSGLMQTLRQVGGTLGVAVVGAGVIAAQGRAFETRVVPLMDAAEADAARSLARGATQGKSESLAQLAALAAARPQIAGAVRAATADGISTGYWLATGACAAALLVAAFVLRNAPAAPPTEPST